ncbi:MAG: substrate-binding domain-containing protein, partial [Pikeienuella sp.]
LATAGLIPGRDIAVVCFRESRQARFLTPRLTCYGLSPREVGQALGRSVLSALPRTREAYAHIPRGLVWPMTFVPGETLIGPPPSAPD